MNHVESYTKYLAITKVLKDFSDDKKKLEEPYKKCAKEYIKLRYKSPYSSGYYLKDISLKLEETGFSFEVWRNCSHYDYYDDDDGDYCVETVKVDYIAVDDPHLLEVYVADSKQKAYEKTIVVFHLNLPIEIYRKLEREKEFKDKYQFSPEKMITKILKDPTLNITELPNFNGAWMYLDLRIKNPLYDKLKKVHAEWQQLNDKSSDVSFNRYVVLKIIEITKTL